jgi:ATP-dependent Lhr-like helicase
LDEIPQSIQGLFDSRGWKPFDFQHRAWQAYLDGHSGLINAPTGVGKTWAAWMGPVIEAVQNGLAGKGLIKRGRGAPVGEPIRVLWITPLRALAGDTTASLAAPVAELELPWTIEMRTGDTAQSIRRRQKDRLPAALVTTPESLTLLLSYPDAREKFASLRCIVVDEWHELMGTKRGVQTELALARLRTFVPTLRTWGVSATLGNLEQARDVLMDSHASGAVLIRGDLPKKLEIETIIPKEIERFPWSGHLGTRSVGEVIEAVRSANTTLLFTNTRSQAEIWFRRLTMETPDLLGKVAIHHGSLDRGLRTRVEAMLDLGKLKCVVCTSSLDLGVDFAPVDQVLQVGSPKGIARLVQRAGRSGHQPGARSRVLGVPAHAFELVEFAAARDAAAEGRIESRPPIERALDVLVQHLVTMACAGGFVEADLRREVMSTNAYARLTDREWHWAMEFVRQGGPALTAYPHFARIVLKEGADGQPGRWIPPDDRTARLHRMGIGTITAETSMSVKYLSGRSLGHIEEGFIARLPAGARFVFAGKVLELIRVRDMTAYVQRAKTKSGIVPRWDGGRFSLSTQLSAAVRRKLDEAREGIYDDSEMRAIRPLLELQRAASVIPAPDELLVETIEVDRIHNLFLFPFQGRAAHEGMGALLAYRLSRRSPISVTSVATDYGIGLRSDLPMHLNQADWAALLSTDNLLDDLAACLNMSNLARRQFRDIARIAGLIIPGFPGTKKPARHLQASSEMFFDVFEEFDPDNLLLDQARREVLQNQLEIVRLREALERAATQRMVFVEPATLTPLSFPIWAEHLRATTLSSEKWADMVRRMVERLEGVKRETDRPQQRGARKRVSNGRAGKHDEKSIDRPGETRSRRGRSIAATTSASRTSVERSARAALGRRGSPRPL